MKTPSQILAEAADLVEFSGRWVNHAPRGDHEVCAAFAILEVAGRRGMATWDFITTVASDALVAEIGERIPDWNDAQTDAIVVATALRNAKRHLPPAEEGL